MKIIVSHDVDHLKVTEHLSSMIIPKFLIRMHIELLNGKISLMEYRLRISNLIKNKWQNILELMNYDGENSIPATYFFGVNNGSGLEYSLEEASEWIRKVLQEGFDCGVHGIVYMNEEGMQKEYETFKYISGLNSFGIRMHYLRKDESLLTRLSDTGYLFDSSYYLFKPSFLAGNIIEFPVHLMDSYEIESGEKWQSKNVGEALNSSQKKIIESAKKGIDYFSLLFHDHYFDCSFQTWKNWYEGIIKYCRGEGFHFINYREAVNEINKK